MKRYALFLYDYYYPRGGWADFHSFRDSIEEALAVGPTNFELFHIVDLQNGRIVVSGQVKHNALVPDPQ